MPLSVCYVMCYVNACASVYKEVIYTNCIRYVITTELFPLLIASLCLFTFIRYVDCSFQIFSTKASKLPHSGQVCLAILQSS